MKKYKYEFTGKGLKTFLALPKNIRNRIEKKLVYFLESGEPLSFATPLKINDHYWRFRIGDFRVIFSVQDELNFIILLVQKVGHRREVYE